MIEFSVARILMKRRNIFNYGSFSNHDLFLMYGFMDVNNALNYMQLPIKARLVTSLNHFQQKLHTGGSLIHTLYWIEGATDW